MDIRPTTSFIKRAYPQALKKTYTLYQAHGRNALPDNGRAKHKQNMVSVL